MSNRPDLEEALDLRSDETLVVLREPPTSGDLMNIHEGSVVVFDRIDATKRTLGAIGVLRPRLVALVPNGVEQEKAMRRQITASYPWAEVWTISSSFGKLLVTKDVQGRPYDRDLIEDQRVA